MSDVVSRAITIGASIVVTIIVITIAIFLAKSGKSLSSSFNDRITSMNTSISDSGLLKYDGEILTGSDVVNCIRKYKDEITVAVYKQVSQAANASNLNVGYQSQMFDYRTSKFVNLPQYSNDDKTGNADGNIYINPNAKFLGHVTKNSNDVIVGISFVQQAWIDDALDRPINNTTIVMSGTIGGGGGGAGGTTDTDARLQQLESAMSNLTSVLVDFIETYYATGGGMSDGILTIQSMLESYFNMISAPGTGVLDQINQQLEKLGAFVGGVPDYGDDSGVSEAVKQLQNQLSDLRDIVVSELATKADLVHFQNQMDELIETSQDLLTRIKDLQDRAEKMQETITKIDKNTDPNYDPRADKDSPLYDPRCDPESPEYDWWYVKDHPWDPKNPSLYPYSYSDAVVQVQSISNSLLELQSQTRALSPYCTDSTLSKSSSDDRLDSIEKQLNKINSALDAQSKQLNELDKAIEGSDQSDTANNKDVSELLSAMGSCQGTASVQQEVQP